MGIPYQAGVDPFIEAVLSDDQLVRAAREMRRSPTWTQVPADYSRGTLRGAVVSTYYPPWRLQRTSYSNEAKGEIKWK